MATDTISTRRDKRLRLRPGSASIEFCDPLTGTTSSRGSLTNVSVAGLAFEVDGETAHLATGVGLERVVIRIGPCVLHGDALVRNVHSTRANKTSVGCLFYPTVRQEDRWTTLLTGRTPDVPKNKRGVTIRCSGCLAAVWLPPARRDEPTSACCDTCERKYVVRTLADSEEQRRALAERAHALARAHEIDLPSAYSVLLGIMSVDDLHLPGGAATPASAPPAIAVPTEARYDPAFQPAIDAGTLSPRQAAERGSREAFATILSARHGLDAALALAVADNRLSLLHAVREREQRARNEGDRVERIPRKALLPAALVLVGLVAVLARAPGIAVTGPMAPGQTRQVGAAEVHADGRGRIVEVLGPDPRSVLRAFCVEAATRGRFEPLEIVPSGRPGGRARLGLLRDPQHPDELLALPILEDTELGRWRAGDGSNPVNAEPAPAGAERALREP